LQINFRGPETDEYSDLLFGFCRSLAGGCGSIHWTTRLDSNGFFPGEIQPKHLAWC